MARRWFIPLLALPVAIGTVVAVLVGVASASPGLTHPAAPTAAVRPGAVYPGSPMISPSGLAVPGRSSNQNVIQTSHNWAGYALSGRSAAFHSVYASWIQPVAHCAGVVSTGQRYAAFWVGLDGFNHRDNAVEQTGSDSDCNGKVPTYYGWYEMYPASPVYFSTPVRAGDLMSASVAFSGTRTYTLVLRDSTRRWTHTIVKNAADLARSSAEVIAEAPSALINGHFVVLPLANFGTVRWTGSKVNGTLLRALPHRIQVVMTDVAGHVKANTSLVGPADAFTNTYVRAT